MPMSFNRAERERYRLQWERSIAERFETTFPRKPDKLNDAILKAFRRPPMPIDRARLLTICNDFIAAKRAGSQREAYASARSRVEAMRKALDHCAETLLHEAAALKEIDARIIDQVVEQTEFAVAFSEASLQGLDPIGELAGRLGVVRNCLDRYLETWSDGYHIAGSEGDPPLYELIKAISALPDIRHAGILIRAVFNAMPEDVHHRKTDGTIKQTIKDVRAGRRG